MEKMENCHPGDKLQVVFHNERGTVNLSIRVSEINVHKEHLRILALNDINIEMDEKEIDSWIRLTRVPVSYTHLDVYKRQDISI